eukprot:Opistho-1_new@78078
MGDYFDIESILRTQEYAPVTFATDAVGLGHLDPGSGETDIPQGSKLELPFWLMRPLAQRNYVVAELPKCYGAGYRAALSADPEVVNLQEWCAFYYDFGLAMSEVVRGDDLPSVLKRVFGQRYKHVMELAQNSLHEDTLKLTVKLDNFERQLFTAGHDAIAEFHKWRGRKMNKLKPSEVAVALRKRKRAADE